MSTIPPALRDYVAKEIAASIPKTPDVQAIAQEVSKTIEAQITAGLNAILQQNLAAIRAEFTTALQASSSNVAGFEAAAQACKTAVADLEARMNRWIADDRYSITRAQVLKIMREDRS